MSRVPEWHLPWGPWVRGSGEGARADPVPRGCAILSRLGELLNTQKNVHFFPPPPPGPPGGPGRGGGGLFSGTPPKPHKCRFLKNRRFWGFPDML